MHVRRTKKQKNWFCMCIVFTILSLKWFKCIKKCCFIIIIILIFLLYFQEILSYDSDYKRKTWYREKWWKRQRQLLHKQGESETFILITRVLLKLSESSFFDYLFKWIVIAYWFFLCLTFLLRHSLCND